VTKSSRSTATRHRRLTLSVLRSWPVGESGSDHRFGRGSGEEPKPKHCRSNRAKVSKPNADLDMGETIGQHLVRPGLHATDPKSSPRDTQETTQLLRPATSSKKSASGSPDEKKARAAPDSAQELGEAVIGENSTAVGRSARRCHGRF